MYGNLTVCGEREDEGQQERSAEPHLEMFARHQIRSEGWSSSDDGSLGKEFASKKPSHAQNVKNSHERIAAACRRRAHKTQSPKKSTHTTTNTRARAHNTHSTNTTANTTARTAGWLAGRSIRRGADSRTSRSEVRRVQCGHRHGVTGRSTKINPRPCTRGRDTWPSHDFPLHH